MNRNRSTISFNEAQKISSPKSFTTMVKPIGSNCNMRCTYCYYLDKGLLYDNLAPSTVMTDKVLREYIAQYIEANDVDTITFCWHGGEPLLAGIKFYEKAMQYQKKYAKGKKIENTLQTNGLLINDDWCKFFHDNDFLVGLSLDGPEDIHDAYRKNVGGAPTFSKVMRAAERLTYNKVEFNTLSVVNNLCAGRGKEVYNFFKSIGSHYMQFLPAVEFISPEQLESLGGRGRILSPEQAGSGVVSEWSTDALDFGRFLCDIFDEWIKTDVGTYYVQMFDVTLANWYGVKPGLCAFSKSCGDGLVVEFNGDVYSCDHFVYPEYLIGNIETDHLRSIYSSKQQFRFGVAKRNNLPDSCTRCKYYFACTGGCPKHRFGRTESDPKANILCEGYKMFFEHVHPYMDKMAALLRSEQAPAKIMDMIK
ncbi:MAG: anaerobic sulfatase-maturation protein [Rikenellaceae bacterium]